MIPPNALETGLVVFGSLFILATAQLRLATLGLLAVFAGSTVLIAGFAPRAEVVLSASAAITAAIILYLAARDATFGENPDWRIWPSIAISAITTALAFLVFRSQSVDQYFQLAAFWLLAAGLGILLTARGAVRAVLGALLMLTGTQDVLRFQTGAHLAATIAFAWLEVGLALVGAYLITSARLLDEAG